MRHVGMLPLIMLAAASSGEGRVDHYLILHIGKTGGTSLRNAVAAFAKEAKLSMQVEYGREANEMLARYGGLTPFDPAHPARVIMGHGLHLTFSNRSFHELLPRGATYRYITMFREPL